MGAVALFGADAVIGPAIAEAALSHGSSVEQLEASQGLSRLSGHDSLDAVIVGPSVGSPVQLAQQTCLADPDLSVVLLAEPLRLDELSRAIQFSPLVGDSVSCGAANVNGLLRLVDDAITRTRLRRRHRLTVQALNAQIAVGRSGALPARASQELLGQLLQRLPVAVIATDAGDRIQAYNQEAEQLFLVSERDALGRRLEDLLGTSASSEVRAEGLRPLADRRPLSLGPRFKHRVVEVEAVATASRSGASGWLWLIHDVTARAEAERERQDAMQRLGVLATAGEVLARTLGQAEMLEALTHLVVPDLADLCFVDLATADGGFDRRAVAHADPALAPVAARLRRHYPPKPTAARLGVAGALATGALVHQRSFDEPTLRQIARDDDHLDALRALEMKATITAPLLARGQVLGALTLVARGGREFAPADATLAQDLATRAGLALDNAALYERARVDKERAEEASLAKDQFLALLGHELRNPLAPIVTALRLMSVHPDADASREKAIITRQVDHLVRLVDDLLDVSRITQGKIQLEATPVELSTPIAQAIEMVRPLVDERGHSLEVDLEPLLVVSGDEQRLAQVFANLLNNAAKYTDRGGHLSIRGRREGDLVVIRIEDDGVGIPADLLPRVFDLFEQAPQALDRSRGGLGLGLAIVRSIVNLHGGRVEAQSEGRGTLMTVRLPASEAAPPPWGTAGGPACAGKARQARRRLRVLVVDDNRDAADLLADAVSANGHEVKVAYDGAEALRVAATFNPSVAVLDIGLPVMDGFELARRLRGSSGPSLRLVAVSGYGSAQDRARGASAGFERHFVKPVDLDELLGVLEG